MHPWTTSKVLCVVDTLFINLTLLQETMESKLQKNFFDVSTKLNNNMACEHVIKSYKQINEYKGFCYNFL